MVEDIDVVEAHALERLVQAGDEVFARAEIAVRTGPHAVAGLGGDDQLVTVGAEILFEQQAERILGGAGHGTVVVGQVEVSDAQVEGAAGHGAGVLQPVDAAEVVPPAERDAGEFQSAAAHAGVWHAVITGIQSTIRHFDLLIK